MVGFGQFGNTFGIDDDFGGRSKRSVRWFFLLRSQGGGSYVDLFLLMGRGADAEQY